MVAPGRSLDVDATQRTFLTVGSTSSVFRFGPLLEVLVPLLKLSARQGGVPRGVATKAPHILALAAGDDEVLCSVAPEQPWNFVLCQQTAVRTRLLDAVFVFSQSQFVELLFDASGDVAQYFIARNDPVLALWVWTWDVNVAFAFDVCTHYLSDAAFADHLRAALSCVVNGFDLTVANCAFSIGGGYDRWTLLSSIPAQIGVTVCICIIFVFVGVVIIANIPVSGTVWIGTISSEERTVVAHLELAIIQGDGRDMGEWGRWWWCRNVDERNHVRSRRKWGRRGRDRDLGCAGIGYVFGGTPGGGMRGEFLAELIIRKEFSWVCEGGFRSVASIVAQTATCM